MLHEICSDSIWWARQRLSTGRLKSKITLQDTKTYFCFNRTQLTHLKFNDPINILFCPPVEIESLQTFQLLYFLVLLFMSFFGNPQNHSERAYFVRNKTKTNNFAAVVFQIDYQMVFHVPENWYFSNELWKLINLPNLTKRYKAFEISESFQQSCVNISTTFNFNKTSSHEYLKSTPVTTRWSHGANVSNTNFHLSHRKSSANAWRP